MAAPATRASKGTSSISSSETETPSYDILIVGAGAPGLLAFLRAKEQGLHPLLLEKTAFLGGTSALSGGSLWIPNNHITRKAGVPDSIENARKYMEATIQAKARKENLDDGPASSPERINAFLTQGPKMVKWLSEMGFKWVAASKFPDYYQRIEGASRGRSIEEDVFDVSRLGNWEGLIATTPHIMPAPCYAYEAYMFGVMMRSLALFLAVLRIMVVRNLWWKLRGRTPVTMGKSLVAQLLFMVREQGLTESVWRETPLVELLVEDGKVVGAVVEREGKAMHIRAKKGVLLCAGGFAQNLKMRENSFNGPSSVDWTMVNAQDNGDGIRVGQSLHAATALLDDAWWYPTFRNPTTGARHLTTWERSLPHSIIVDSRGKRFMNEAQSYVDCGQEQYERDKSVSAIPAWLILDSNHRKKYMLWHMLPGKTPDSALTEGVLKKGASLAELAKEIGVDAKGLASTVSHFNEMAAQGIDDDFGRGSSIFDEYWGDPTMKANFNLGTLDVAPFYAVQIWPGDLGTKGGLLTDEFARVLRKDGKFIEGLYAAGNTSASVMGRTYPGPGSTLGPAMTFAFVAVDHAAHGEEK